MKRNNKLMVWVLAVAFVAVVVGRIATSGSPNASDKLNISTVPTSVQATSPPGQTTAATAQSAGQPVGQPNAQPAVQPVRPRNGRTAPPAVSMTIYDLDQLMDAKPTSITSLDFVNGQNTVLVTRQGSPNFYVQMPDDGGKQELRAKALADKIPFAVQDTPQDDPVLKWLGNNFLTLLIFGLMIGFFIMSQRKQTKQITGLGGMASSRATDADNKNVNVKKVTFKDVAGCDEAVKELRRVVKGIVGADIYQLFEAELPKGVLLVGPPGTGKTLLAKAVAGESDGSFDITSGSDFVEMYVGVGAARVRDMFKKARKKVAETKKPHVIFIDEIDAVGGKRGGGPGAGSNSEREQTLNQILVEMDGMVGNDGILVIAATNRVDMLDAALLRPGRFDCHVNVDLPDKAGREAIFKIHLGKRKLADGVTLSGLAHRTYGYSGAEIKGVCNRAAILAAESYALNIAQFKAQGLTDDEIKDRLRPEVNLNHFDEGVDFVRYGNAAESKQARMAESDKLNTAVHEGGHAVSAAVLTGCDPVVKITIMRRSKALGYVQYLPDNDRVSFTRDQALCRIVSMMAGRAAQEVILGTCDTGASNDFQQATDMSRKMVASWGMSKLGHISVGDRQDALGTSGGPNSVGPDLSNEIDREWRAINAACFQAAKDIVTADRERIDSVVKILMDRETVLADEWKDLLAKIPSKFDIKTLDLPKAA